MSIFIVTPIAGGAEVYRYQNDVAVNWPQYPFSSYTHTATPEAPVPPAPTPAPVRITKFAFRSRFTDAEKIAIELSALDVPSGDAQARSIAAQMRVWLDDIAVAEYIDLTMTATRAGVQALEDYGLLAAGRAAVILDTPPTEDEVWHG